MEYELYLMELVKIRYILIGVLAILVLIAVIETVRTCAEIKREMRIEIKEELDEISNIKTQNF